MLMGVQRCGNAEVCVYRNEAGFWIVRVAMDSVSTPRAFVAALNRLVKKEPLVLKYRLAKARRC
jgi:hypothetical protein